MDRKIFSLASVFLLLAVGQRLAQGQQAASPEPIPAATRSEIECAGFVSAASIPTETYVEGGADNDLRSPYRQFARGQFVFLRGGQSVAEGAEYRLVRVRSFGHNSWYSGQSRSIGSLGQPYEDMGRVKVISVTPQGAVAEVAFACGPIAIGDIALPFQAREIPSYTPSGHFDRFVVPKGKLTGNVVAAASNSGVLKKGSLAYINLGESDGARAGQKYRIFHIDRDILKGVLTPLPEVPAESVGELVVLFTEDRSSVAIVVLSAHEGSVGDGIVLEE